MGIGWGVRLAPTIRDHDRAVREGDGLDFGEPLGRMTVIDIHTHMFGDAWMKQFLAHGGEGNTTMRLPGGLDRLVVDGAPDLALVPALFDYAKRIEDMDANGIDIAVVSLTSPNCFFGDEAVSCETARMVNDDMAAAQSAYPDRIRFFATIPWEYPDRAVAELERALELGAVGIMVLAHIRDRRLIDDHFAPVWQTIDDHGLPVLVHPTTAYGAKEGGFDIVPFISPSVGFTYDTTLALVQMAMTGFLDRYPNLKIIGSHGGGYLPYISTRLDMFARLSPAAMEASGVMEQLARFYLDAIVYSQSALNMCLELVGPDRVLFGTDYPMPADFSRLHELTNGSPADQREKVRGGNARRIFNL